MNIFTVVVHLLTVWQNRPLFEITRNDLCQIKVQYVYHDPNCHKFLTQVDRITVDIKHRLLDCVE